MGKGYYDDDYGLDAWLDEGYDGVFSVNKT